MNKSRVDVACSDIIRDAIEKSQRSLKEITDIVTWAEKHYFINDQPYSIAKHQYLREILQDNHPDVTIKKSAQCGVSEFAVLVSMWFLSQFDENVFYAFPNKEQIGDFVRERVNVRVDESPPLRQLVEKTDNIGMKQLCGNSLFFRGSNSRKQIISVPAGFLVLDELDEMVQNHITTMMKRLGASKYKRVLKLSTPTYEDYGIDFEYNQTDQREYHTQCPHCEKWQALDFFRNIYPKPPEDGHEQLQKDRNGNDIAVYVCNSCNMPIDNTTPGKWIAKHPDIKKRGYHVSKLFIEPADMLWNTYRDALKKSVKDVQEFYNSDLGLAYSPAGGKLTDKDLNACWESIEKVQLKNCYMGVDVGKHLHVMIGKQIREKKYRVYIGTITDFEELDVLMKQYDVGQCVIDALPETRKAKEFAERHPSRVMLAYYNVNDRNVYTIPDPDDNKIRLHRTNCMDYASNQILIKNTRLPIGCNSIPDFYDQMKAPQKVEELNEKTGNIEYAYLEGSQADHYYHANTYLEVAMMEERPVSIDAEDVKTVKQVDEEYEDGEAWFEQGDSGFSTEF